MLTFADHKLPVAKIDMPNGEARRLLPEKNQKIVRVFIRASQVSELSEVKISTTVGIKLELQTRRGLDS